MAKYTIGVDFGTLSGRAVLVSLETGEEIATAVYDYPHKVMETALPCGKPLEKNSALQHPKDYVETLSHSVQEVMKISGINPEDVIGIGIDFTACTMFPVDDNGVPLCYQEKWASEPQAYVKLWKHHAAQAEADEITALAKKEGKNWLERYGGKISSEWLFPKMLETIHKCPEVYHEATRFMEAGDWLTWLLTGKEIHSSCMAGYKGNWHHKEGYPDNEFLTKLHPDFDGVVGTKVSENVLPAGTLAGYLTEDGAAMLGLCPGTAVSVPLIDAFAALPAADVTGSGKLMLVIGTSSCHILLSEKEQDVPGICGVVKDGAVAGFYSYEAGQACVGDHFAWFMDKCLPAEEKAQAEKEGKSVYALMREKAEKLSPGESGIIALDWWNGNRTPYVDANLSGVFLGMSLTTRPEELYRALIEATAYGTKQIINTYEKGGVPTGEIIACGGIAEKDPFTMQIYADVCGRNIRVCASPQAGALGSAMHASVASGYYKNLSDAAKVMAKLKDVVYRPIPEHTAVYEKLYAEYITLAEYFTKENQVMKRLMELRK